VPNETFSERLERLRNQASRLQGRPVAHFLCPILFTDEETALCKAHVINQAFSDSSRKWTIQRKDIDNFFGSIFEGPFLDIQLRFKMNSVYDALIDKTLRSRLRPKLIIDDRPIDYFVADPSTPESFPRIIVETSKGQVQLALKVPVAEILSGSDHIISVEISQDRRIESFVSILKAAHLTLFSMLGYDYALSYGGKFLGRAVLGEFYMNNAVLKSTEVIKNAKVFFQRYEFLAKPIIESSADWLGTIDDDHMLVCRTSNGDTWAAVVLVRTASLRWAVLVPICEGDNRESKLLQILSYLRGGPGFIDVSSMKRSEDKTRWEIGSHSIRLDWPKDSKLI
jgi:hypothetical protein